VGIANKKRMPPTIAPKKEDVALTRFLNSDIQIDREARTISFSFSSKYPVERWTWRDDLPEGASNVFDEVLSQSSLDWLLDRVKGGVCPYLKNHDRNQKLGQVTSVSFDGDRGTCTVKMRRTQAAMDHLSDVEDNTAGGVSFGYVVGKYKVISPAVYEYDDNRGYKVMTKKAILEGSEILLLEISSEEIPADPTVGFGKSFVNLRTVSIDGDPNFSFGEEQKMPPEIDNTVQLRTQVDALTTERDRISKELATEKAKFEELTREHTSLSAQVKGLTEQVEQKDAKIALFEKREAVSTGYYSLRTKAEELVSDAKLTAVEFNDLFGENAQADIDKYVRAENSAIALGQIEFYIERVAKRQPLLKIQSQLASEPLPAPEGEQPKVDEEKVKRLLGIVNTSRAL
jgi:hypothetical protein